MIELMLFVVYARQTVFLLTKDNSVQLYYRFPESENRDSLFAPLHLTPVAHCLSSLRFAWSFPVIPHSVLQRSIFRSVVDMTDGQTSSAQSVGWQAIDIEAVSLETIRAVLLASVGLFKCL